MVDPDLLARHLDRVLDDATIPELPNHYRGKVRDNYDLPDGPNGPRRIIIATDRLSAFDRNIAAIPFKGQVLTQIARFWFDRTADLCPNHVIEYPDPNVLVCRRLDILPVEVVVRDYLAGTTATSVWSMYRAGRREIYGIRFPDGLRENEKLPETIVTPTTKARDGEHDEPVTAEEIIGRGLLTPPQWAEVTERALALFARGRDIAAARGLILVDTKYEFGLDRGAPDLEAFWQLLVSGTDAVTEVDEARWSTHFFYHPNQDERGKSYTWSAGLLTGIDLFEPAFFGISPREAAQMDPQQRLLLELVWHALEDAGIPAGKVAGSATGVYIGGATTDYRDLRLGDPATGDSYFMTGGTLSILANRISYVFDLHGPSFTVDTACSSSLVALNAACEALREGRIASAIVGGVNLLLTPYPFLGFCRASMLSRRGRCFAFDERADGYVRGEGGGVVLLKPLAQALADGDPVRAVIRGTGVNSDGRTIGLSMPSDAAQARLIRSVCERAR